MDRLIIKDQTTLVTTVLYLFRFKLTGQYFEQGVFFKLKVG